jgi:hypothetical protein
MNYTKGEWYIEKTYGSIPEIRTKERRIAKPLYHMGSEDPEVEANSYLIAAAPDMYEALQAAKEYLYLSGVGMGIYNLVCDALNKAEGRAIV